MNKVQDFSSLFASPYSPKESDPQWERGLKASVLLETKLVSGGPGWELRALGQHRRNTQLSSLSRLTKY